MSPQLLKIKKPEIFDFEECLWFLDRNLDDCMHTVHPGSVQKLIPTQEGKVLFEVYDGDEFIVVKILSGLVINTTPILDFVTEWFDLDRDIAAFYKIMKKDPDLKPLVKKYYGLRLVGIPDFFEVLCWCIIGQQINLTFAYKVKRKLVEKYGSKLIYENNPHYIFPSPEVISNLTIQDLRDLQLTTRKAEYLIGVANLFVSGTLSKENILALKNEETMKSELMKIRGIGEWTANYAVMKGLRGMTCLPYGDSGINQALLNFKNIPKKDNRKEVDETFKPFQNWRSYLVYYLWRSLRN